MVTNADKILIAGMQIAQDVGLAGLRVDRVARRAGINKRLIYHYFGSRDGLCDAIEAQALGQLADASTLGASSRSVLVDLIGSLPPVALNATLQTSAGVPEVAKLGAVVWPGLLARYAARPPGSWAFDDAQWVGFCAELLGVFFVAVHSAKLGSGPAPSARSRLRQMLREQGPRQRLKPRVRY